MDYTTIAFEKKERIGILYLNRPEVLNALSPRMREELTHCLDHAANDEDLRVLILTGKGRGFCAGADLNMFKDAYERLRSGDEHQGFGDIDLPKAFIDFPKPLIAAINGPAVGFGLTVTLTCDIRIASEKAKFGCAFVRVGVTPEFGSSYFLPRLLGYGKAAELAFTARTIDAQEAAQIGLVNRVVSHESLLSECEEMARAISEMPVGAIRMTKQILRHGHHSTLEQALPYEGLVFQHQTRTREHYDAVCRILEQLKSRS
jgi:2-(1,2-epoxy-1,2-dihydrophenyl)acetyl-CoA isomerase